MQQSLRLIDYVPDGTSRTRATWRTRLPENLSLFQSVPDSWAIPPALPRPPAATGTGGAHAARRPGGHHVRLATGRSTGSSTARVKRHDSKLHPLTKDAPTTRVLFFLVGAYQEILGELHKPGRRHERRARRPDDAGRPRLKDVLRGERARAGRPRVREYFEPRPALSISPPVEKALAGREEIKFEDVALLYRRTTKRACTVQRTCARTGATGNTCSVRKAEGRELLR